MFLRLPKNYIFLDRGQKLLQIKKHFSVSALRANLRAGQDCAFKKTLTYKCYSLRRGSLSTFWGVRGARPPELRKVSKNQPLSEKLGGV